MQVWFGDQKVWSGQNNNFPPETVGRCELSTSWERNPNTDLTARLKAVEPGLEVPVKFAYRLRVVVRVCTHQGAL